MQQQTIPQAITLIIQRHFDNCVYISVINRECHLSQYSVDNSPPSFYTEAVDWFYYAPLCVVKGKVITHIIYTCYGLSINIIITILKGNCHSNGSKPLLE